VGTWGGGKKKKSKSSRVTFSGGRSEFGEKKGKKNWWGASQGFTKYAGKKGRRGKISPRAAGGGGGVGQLGYLNKAGRGGVKRSECVGKPRPPVSTPALKFPRGSTSLAPMT